MHSRSASRKRAFSASVFTASRRYVGGRPKDSQVRTRMRRARSLFATSVISRPKSASRNGAWDGMTEADLDYYNKMYLGDQDPNDCPYYNIYVNDLTWGIPPCFIVAAELDPLRDDNRLLYEVLTDKGVHCEYHEYKGALHAFIHYSKVMDDAEDALRRGAHFFAHECGLDPRN